MRPIVVRRLLIESIADGTLDPYGQPGFSVLIARVDIDDEMLDRQLRQFADDGSTVVIRCTTIEVEGRVERSQFIVDPKRKSITILIDDLRYFKPRRQTTVEYRKLD
jgi:hypothetical protein